MNNIYSSHQLEDAIRQSIHFVVVGDDQSQSKHNQLLSRAPFSGQAIAVLQPDGLVGA
jgi:hypothetical protein